MKRTCSRTRWNSESVQLLRACFLCNQFPDIEDVSSLAVLCGTTNRKIQIWFQNARQRKLQVNSKDILNATLYFIN